MRRVDIRQYFLGLTRDNVNFREQLKYLVDSRQIFKPEYGWLLKQVMQYAFGVPAPLEEDMRDMAKSLVFLSMNPIGQEQHDPLAMAKPIGPRELAPAADPEPETSAPPTLLDGAEVEILDAPPPEPTPRLRAPDYR